MGPFEQLDLLGKPCTMKEIWGAFARLGEVTVKLSHLTIKRDGTDITVDPVGNLVFALERVRSAKADKKPKKAKAKKAAKEKKGNKKVKDDDAEVRLPAHAHCHCMLS
jgi:hypothetical protein